MTKIRQLFDQVAAAIDIQVSWQRGLDPVAVPVNVAVPQAFVEVTGSHRYGYRLAIPDPPKRHRLRVSRALPSCVIESLRLTASCNNPQTTPFSFRHDEEGHAPSLLYRAQWGVVRPPCHVFVPISTW